MWIAFGTFWISFRVRDRESERGYSPRGERGRGERKEGEDGSEAIEAGVNEETNVLTLYRCEMPRGRERESDGGRKREREREPRGGRRSGEGVT